MFWLQYITYVSVLQIELFYFIAAGVFKGILNVSLSLLFERKLLLFSGGQSFFNVIEMTLCVKGWQGIYIPINAGLTIDTCMLLWLIT